MAAQEIEVGIKTDTTEIEASYAKILELEKERAANAAVLIEQTINLRKKELRESEKMTQSLISQQEKLGESAREQLNKPIEESVKKTRELEAEIKRLTPATEKVTAAQEQLGKTVKRVQGALRGFAVTAAIAFGAAILKGVFDMVKGLFEAGRATKILEAAMEDYQKSAGEAVGKSKALFSELRAAAPGTKKHGELVAEINKQYGDIVRLSPQSTIEQIAAAEALVNAELTKQARLTAQRNALAAAFGEEESLRLQIISDKAQGVNDIIITAKEKELASIREANVEIEQTFNDANASAIIFKDTLNDAAGAATNLGKAVAGGIDSEATKKAAADRKTAAEKAAADLKTNEDKAAADRQAAADKAAADIKANFEQASKAIQALSDDFERNQIENIEDEKTRLVALATFNADVQKRIAEDTIINQQQLSETLLLIDRNLFNEVQKIVGDEPLAAASGEIENVSHELTDRLAPALDVAALAANNFEHELQPPRRMQERIEHLQAYGTALGNVGSAFQELSQIVGEETEAGAKLAKAAAVFSILASQAQAIASVVAMAGEASKSGGPAAPAVFIATLVSGLAITAVNIAKAKQLIEGAELPKFAEGEVNINGPGGPKTDSILARISKGESVINAASTRKHEDALEAINTDRFHEYLNKTFIYPAMMMAQSTQKQKDVEQTERMIKAYFDNAFDDGRLHRDNEQQTRVLKVIATRLKPKPQPSPRSR